MLFVQSKQTGKSACTCDVVAMCAKTMATYLHGFLRTTVQPIYWLIIVDSFSKWPEIFCFTKMPDTDTMLTKLKFLFASMGLPEECISDSGQQFTSEEFKHFLQMNGIVQKLSAPYCPATNRLAERMVPYNVTSFTPIGLDFLPNMTHTHRDMTR